MINGLIVLFLASVSLIVYSIDRKIYKKSISTFLIQMGILIYSCCSLIGHSFIAGIFLSVVVGFIVHRAAFKPEAEKLLTWKEIHETIKRRIKR